MRRFIVGRLAALGIVTVLYVTGCVVNPATGQREFSFIGEDREISMGRRADVQIQASIGLYVDSSVQKYVSDLGLRLAALSERPHLPWSFRVLDDDIVNAFALPGGFIYVTRGILAHLDSEAELAGVLGHEIGHVTALHSVNQMERAGFSQVLVGGLAILAPQSQPFLGVANSGLQLLSLKHGRGDEREADRLGFRYMTRGEYDPRQLADVFELLGRVSAQAGGDRIPGWLSTHPDPGDRRSAIEQMVADSSFTATGSRIARDPYLRRLEGMVYGEDPREGYFSADRFLHPELAFELTFPEGWTKQNQTSQVVGISPAEDAILVLGLVDGSSPRGARSAFVAQEGIGVRDRWEETVNGISTLSVEFSARTEGGGLLGIATFLALGDNVFRILGYTGANALAEHRSAFEASAASFAQITDPEILGVEARRITIVELPRVMTVEEFEELFPSPGVSAEAVRLINQVSPGETLPAGLLMKRLIGGVQ